MARTPVSQLTLLNAATSTTTGTAVDTAQYDNDERNFVAYITGTGSVSATVVIEVSNNNVHWITLGTISLSGTGSSTDGFVGDESWQFARARLSAISGTSAAVTVTMGI